MYLLQYQGRVGGREKKRAEAATRLDVRMSDINLFLSLSLSSSSPPFFAFPERSRVGLSILEAT